ncbi:MAG: hypothetical protein NZZ41_02820 [Candidatus Dojkabacteria bacterium]|nr:hypothetical protein [Candidatus Dojkabacteria bacterium]
MSSLTLSITGANATHIHNLIPLNSAGDNHTSARADKTTLASQTIYSDLFSSII